MALTGLTDQPRDKAQEQRIGTIELNAFRILSYLGEGTFGTAYLTKQLHTEREAVLKIAHANLVRGPSGQEVRRRFAAELRAATKVKHPNLVTIFTSGETGDGLPAIAMEYVEGETLGTLLQREAPLGREWLEVFPQLASALDCLHGKGILHRDVAPGNVMLTRDHGGAVQAVLLDFGMAMFLGHGSSHRLVGTPHFVAPEQLLMAPEPASDLHGLGALLWWAVCGQPMRRGSSGDPVARPQELNPALQDDMARLLEQLVDQDPKKRPTAAELMQRWPALAANYAQVAVEARRSDAPRGSLSPLDDQLRVLVLEPNPVWRRMLGKVAQRSGATAKLEEKFELGYGEASFDLIVASSHCEDSELRAVLRFAEQHPGTRLILATRGEETAWSDEFDSEVAVPGELRAMEELLHDMLAQRVQAPTSQRSISWPGGSHSRPAPGSVPPTSDPTPEPASKRSAAPTLPPRAKAPAAEAPSSAGGEHRLSGAGMGSAPAPKSSPARPLPLRRPLPAARGPALSGQARSRRRTTDRRMPLVPTPQAAATPEPDNLLGQLPDLLAALSEAASASRAQSMARLCGDVARVFEQLGGDDSARVATMYEQLLSHGAADDLDAIVSEVEHAYLDLFRSLHASAPPENHP